MSDFDYVEAINRAQLEFTTQISSVINDLLTTHEGDFADRPSVPYTVVIATMARTIGHITAMFPEQERERIVRFCVEELLEQQHKMLHMAHTDLHMMRDFGRA